MIHLFVDVAIKLNSNRLRFNKTLIQSRNDLLRIWNTCPNIIRLYSLFPDKYWWVLLIWRLLIRRISIVNDRKCDLGDSTFIITHYLSLLCICYAKNWLIIAQMTIDNFFPVWFSISLPIYRTQIAFHMTPFFFKANKLFVSSLCL